MTDFKRETGPPLSGAAAQAARSNTREPQALRLGLKIPTDEQITNFGKGPSATVAEPGDGIVAKSSMSDDELGAYLAERAAREGLTGPAPSQQPDVVAERRKSPAAILADAFVERYINDIETLAIATGEAPAAKVAIVGLLERAVRYGYRHRVNSNGRGE